VPQPGKIANLANWEDGGLGDLAPAVPLPGPLHDVRRRLCMPWSKSII
jgi:hypothetical protein